VVDAIEWLEEMAREASGNKNRFYLSALAQTRLAITDRRKAHICDRDIEIADAIVSFEFWGRIESCGNFLSY
jgi:hypothetical protein